MATRFYLHNSGSPAVSPAPDSGWEQTGSLIRYPLVRKLTLSALAALANSSAVTVPITTTQDILGFQFVSEPIPQQTIIGTFSIVLRVLENAATNNVTLAVNVRVVSNDGGTLRGILYSTFSIGTEFATSSQTRIVSAQAVTSIAAQYGDRIVVEVGGHAAAPTAAGSYTVRLGDSAASDFALTSALTTDLNPWCEFSQDLWPAMPNNYRSVKGGTGLSFGERIR